MSRDRSAGVQVPGIGDRWDPLENIGYDARPNERGSHAGKGPRNWRRSDERIHDDVCSALERSGEVDASGIEVIVTDGEVFLTGLVGDRQQKRAAVGVVEHVQGIVDVHNRLEVPRGGPPPDPNQSDLATETTVTGTTRESWTGRVGVTS